MWTVDAETKSKLINHNAGRSVVLQVICCLLIFLLVYTATSKLLDIKSFQLTLHASPLITDKNILVSWLVPAAELFIALLLLRPSTRLTGLYGAAFLLMVFTLYLGYMILFTPNRPCICGGVIRVMSWSQHIVFNLFFTLLALAGIQIQRKLTYRNVHHPGSPPYFV